MRPPSSGENLRSRDGPNFFDKPIFPSSRPSAMVQELGTLLDFLSFVRSFGFVWRKCPNLGWGPPCGKVGNMVPLVESPRRPDHRL